MGKRSILEHFQKIGFDFNKLVDKSFKSLGFYFLPLPAGIEIMMCFLSEGVKLIYRFTYAILKFHKDFIKTNCLDPDTMI
jgi:hypothetical protein